MEETLAVDLIDHPGFKHLLADVTREAKAARAVIFNDVASEKEQSHARGSLKVLQHIVLAVFKRANHEPPAHVAALFE